MRHWKVIRPSKPPLYVDADYLTYEGGIVRFKRASSGDYSKDVHVIAPRYWSEVVEVNEVNEARQPPNIHTTAPWLNKGGQK